MGLALFASDGYQSTTGANYNMFDLASQPVLSLKQRVPLDTVRMLPHSKTTIQFLRVLRGTVFEVKPVGFERIVARCFLRSTPARRGR